MWIFAALSTVEPPIVDRDVVELLEAGKSWQGERRAMVDERIRTRLGQLATSLGAREWLDGAFSAADLALVHVLRRLEGSGLLEEYPTLAAYIARAETRPAYQRAFAAQRAAFTGGAWRLPRKRRSRRTATARDGLATERRCSDPAVCVQHRAAAPGSPPASSRLDDARRLRDRRRPYRWRHSMRLFLLALLSSMVAVAAPAQAQPAPAPPENTGPNTTIVRTVTGKMTFRTLSDGRVRGGEEFRLLVHPDGTRQIFISKDFKAVNAQQSMMSRVDARFRPLETYASYWTRDGFKGSMYVTVSGNELNAVAFGPKGRIETTLQVPPSISVVHHGEVMNGWYYWSEDPASTAPQTSGVYVLNAAPRGDAQVAGFLTESRFTRLGTEKVTTPAGTFDAVHYRLEGLEALEMWVAGEDRLLVRQTDARNDREYLLTELTIAPRGK